ncbi:MAG: Na+/H+ antiporter subunit E [Firmicutes bacterium]|jgi:multicomponent Na+:H+ antiporter subunit E|nr:Na+/H+ antiporter subunit E [Bacillota bacterium]
MPSNRSLLDGFKRDLGGSLLIAVLMLAFWLVVSNSLHWQHILTGIFISFLTTLLWNEINAEEKVKTGFNCRQVVRTIRYLFCLLWEIIKANFVVAGIVLNPRLPISPALLIMKINLKRDLTRVLFANSITLTPGTVTLELEGDRLIVHGITKDHVEGVRDWYLLNMANELEESGE